MDINNTVILKQIYTPYYVYLELPLEILAESPYMPKIKYVTGFHNRLFYVLYDRTAEKIVSELILKQRKNVSIRPERNDKLDSEKDRETQKIMTVADFLSHYGMTASELLESPTIKASVPSY